MTDFTNPLARLHAEMAAAQARFDVHQPITLCAVSKTQPASVLRDAYTAGQKDFGENYLQEALLKQAELTDCAITWHFIGPIQSNKTQAIAQHFDWVHSVDRLKIAQRLSAARLDSLPPLNICLQVNISHELSKSGASEDEICTLALQISQLPRLRLRGLMAIPAPCEAFEAQRDQFRQVRALFDELNRQGLALDTLSMGMSGDYAAAIAEGATIIRVGTALFGARPAKVIDPHPAEGS